MTIGEKIYNLRKLAELSQESLAEKLDVSRQTVSKWERDECQPELDKVIAVCKLFNISTDELLIDKKQPKINATLQDIVDRNQQARKKKNAVMVFIFSLVLMLITVGLTPVMQMYEKNLRGSFHTNMIHYLNDPPLSIFKWVAIIGMIVGVVLFAYQLVKEHKKDRI